MSFLNNYDKHFSGGLDLLDPVRSADAFDRRREAEEKSRAEQIIEQYNANLEDPALIAESITEMSDEDLLSLVKATPDKAGEIIMRQIRLYLWQCAEHGAEE